MLGHGPLDGPDGRCNVRATPGSSRFRVNPARSRGGRGGTEQPVSGFPQFIPARCRTSPPSFRCGWPMMTGTPSPSAAADSSSNPSINGGYWRAFRYDEVVRAENRSPACPRTSSSPSEHGQQASRASVRPRESPMDRARSTNIVRSCPLTSASAMRRLGRTCDEVISVPASMISTVLSCSARSTTQGQVRPRSRLSLTTSSGLKVVLRPVSGFHLRG